MRLGPPRVKIASQPEYITMSSKGVQTAIQPEYITMSPKGAQMAS